MVNYKESKIYKIYCPDVEDSLVYIGSTTKKYLSQRMGGHREEYYKYPATDKFITVFEIFGTYDVENCIIELIENFPCDELHGRVQGFRIKKVLKTHPVTYELEDRKGEEMVKVPKSALDELFIVEKVLRTQPEWRKGIVCEMARVS